VFNPITRVNTIDNPFLAPPGTYPPATVRWDYASNTAPAGFASFVVPLQPGTPLGLEIPVVWTVANLFFRIETVGTTNTTIQFARYTGTGAFATTNLLNATPIIIPAGSYESVGRPYTLATFNMPLVNSFDKLEPIIVLGAGVTVVEFYLTLTQVPGQ